MELSRRSFLAGTAAATLTGTSALAAACAPQTGRNVVMFFIDDLRDWVGYMGTHPGNVTPNIDALRAESFSFNRAYCAVPTCPGSRASTIWGKRPGNTHVISNNLGPRDTLLASNAETIPELFSSAGFTTYNTGKFFHNAVPDRWDVTLPYDEIQDFRDTTTPEFKQTFFDFGPLPSGEIHRDQRTATWFSSQIQSAPEKFFMGVGFYQPHVPWRIPQWALDLHPLNDVVVPQPNCVDDLDDVPAPGRVLANRPIIFGQSNYDRILGTGRAAELVQAYQAAISHTDAMVGQVMNALASSPHADSTDVLLVSDHGYHLGEKLHWRKATLWEQATRVPLLVRSPHLPAGGSLDSPVSMIDVAPTLLDMAGIAAHAGHDGRSLLGADEAYADAHPVQTNWLFNRSIRWQKWRYIHYNDGSQELYDLETDPQECTNLIGSPGYEAITASLRNMRR